MSVVEKMPGVVGTAPLVMGGCDANLMKNVWEIRARDYYSKITSEQERLEKSALATINEDWYKRMTLKAPPKSVRRRDKPEETISVSGTDFNNFLKQRMSYERGRGLPGMQQKDKRGTVKGSALDKLLHMTLNEPVQMKWTKSWKFSKALGKPEEGETPPADWGQSWKFLSHQPHVKGKKHWTEHDCSNNNVNKVSLWKKDSRLVETQHFEHNLPMPEWEMSWKKCQIKHKSEAKEGTANGSSPYYEGGTCHSKARMFKKLVAFQHHNKALSSSEWTEGWKTTKPPKGDEAHADNGPTDQKPKAEEKSGPQYGESWKFMNHGLQKSPANKPTSVSTNPEWAGSWRAAMNPPKELKKPKSYEHVVFHKDSKECPLHKIIVCVSREQKYRDLWSSLFCEECKPHSSEWSKSWKVAKNSTKHSAEAYKKVEEHKKVEDHKAKMPKDVKLEVEKGTLKYDEMHKAMHSHKVKSKMAMYNKFVGPLLLHHDMSKEWHEAWKLPKPQCHGEWLKHDMPDVSMVLKKHMTNRSLPDWSESWKCARTHSRHGQPSVAQWKESWFSRYQPHKGREYWLKEAGHENHSAHCPKHEVFHLPQRCYTPKMYGLSHHTEREKEWKDSWKCPHLMTANWAEEQLKEHPMEIYPRREKLPISKVKLSTSFNLEVFHQRYPPTQWCESWKAAHLQHQHQKKSSILTSSRYHVKSTKASIPEWQYSWKCLSIQLNQHHEAWDGGLFTFPINLHKGLEFSLSHVDNHSHAEPHHHHVESAPKLEDHHGKQAAVSKVTSAETVSRWFKSWRICYAQPQGSWVDTRASQFQHAVVWSRNTGMDNHLFANLKTDTATFRLWGKSFVFLKRESKLADSGKSGKKSKESGGDGMVIMSKKIKTRKSIYSGMDKDKPSEKRWIDCHKIAKQQPRPKRNSWLKMPQANTEEEQGFAQLWEDSWKFSIQKVIKKEETASVSLSGWGEAWKFFIAQYPPQNGPKNGPKNGPQGK